MKIRNYIVYVIFMCFFISFFDPTYALNISNHIDVRNTNISWTHGMNNNIRIIHFDDSLKYFKECKEKVSAKSEIERILEEYFEEYLPYYIPADKELLSKTLSDPHNSEKFINAGFMWDRKSRLFKYINDEIDSSYLGVPICVAKKLSVDLKDLFLYASRELVQRCISYDIELGERQTGLATKQLATYKLAKHLGIDAVTVKSELVELITNHGNKIGVLTDQTEGLDISELQNMKVEIAPKFQMELNDLQVLDTITGEQDHNPGNCSFKIAGNNLVGVMAFDNEGGFVINTNLQKGLCWGKTSPLLTQDNKINLPHMSKSLAEKILATQDGDIEKIFKNMLSDNQLASLRTRFNKVKSAIANTVSGNDNFLLTDDEWSKETLEEEISGNYGNAYLCHYLKNIKTIN